MKKPSESDLVRQCLDYLRMKGILAWRANQIPVPLPNGKGYRRFNGMKGVSDILGILDDGRLLACECKMPGGRLRPEQAEFIDAVRNRGGLACVVRDVKELQAELDGNND